MPDQASIELSSEHSLDDLVGRSVLLVASQLLPRDALSCLEDNEMGSKVQQRVRMQRSNEPEGHLVGVGRRWLRPCVLPLGVFLDRV